MTTNTEPLTTTTVIDADIGALSRYASKRGDTGMVSTCMVALEPSALDFIDSDDDESERIAYVGAARQRCVDAINAARAQGSV